MIFAVEFGPRVDLAAAFTTWRFDLKLVLVLDGSDSPRSGACIALARPSATGVAWRSGVPPVLLLAAAALAVELS